MPWPSLVKLSFVTRITSADMALVCIIADICSLNKTKQRIFISVRGADTFVDIIKHVHDPIDESTTVHCAVSENGPWLDMPDTYVT